MKLFASSSLRDAGCQRADELVSGASISPTRKSCDQRQFGYGGQLQRSAGKSMTMLANWLNRHSPTASKQISIAGRPLTVNHLGDTDAYFGSIQDDYAPDLQRFCRENLTHDSVVFDIGANIGLTSCIFSQHAGNVYAFEPNPSVFPLLQQNVQVNDLRNVSVHNLAVGATSGTTHFAGESAFGYMTKDHAAPAVRVETVDRLVSEFGLDHLDLLKIDVEGFEPDVLAGARETISRFKPTIYMEFNAFCLMNNGRFNPVDFAERLLADYATVQIMRDSGPELAPSSATILTHENLFKYGSVNDLVLQGPRF